MVAMRLIAVRCLDLVVIVMHITRRRSCEFTMLVDKWQTIRPHLVFFEVTSDMHLCKGLLDVLSQHMLCVSKTSRKLILDCDQFVLNLLKLVEGAMAMDLQAFKLIQRSHGVMEQMHDAVRAGDGMLS